MRQETCNSNWFAIRGQKGIRLENEIFIAAAASSSGFFHMDHLWISIFFVHLDRYLRCSSSSSASNDQSIEQIQLNISSIATLSFLSSTYTLNIMFKFHNRNQSIVQNKTVTLNGFWSQQLQHRNKIYLSTLRWNCINATFFSAGTTSATCNKLCDQKIATRTARWVHRSCAKMEERTEFRVYSGPDHSHCIPKWPATITGRL